MEETPAYWRIIFDYPPFNVADGTMFQALQDLLARINVDPSLRVVVFESANHDFYLSHFDLTGKLGNVMTAVGPSGLPVLVDTFVRITRSPVVSIAKIRGCVRGACSEFVLACDMRFASRDSRHASKCVIVEAEPTQELLRRPSGRPLRASVTLHRKSRAESHDNESSQPGGR